MASPTSAPDIAEAIHEVVPARAVLTELARGFLLVRESDPNRAVRFAVTFLREYAEPVGGHLPTATAVPSPAQRGFGLPARGAVERLDPRPPH